MDAKTMVMGTTTTAREAVRQFYADLAFAVGPGLPTRPGRWGMAWMSRTPGQYHSVCITPYLGRVGVSAGHERLLPRLSVNCYDMPISRARCKLWSMHAGLDAWHEWRQSENRLEFTIGLEELGKVGAWLASWARAVDLQDVTKLLPCPVEVERELTPEQWLRTSYVWSRAANAEYARRRPTPKPGELVVGGQVTRFARATR